MSQNGSTNESPLMPANANWWAFGQCAPTLVELRGHQFKSAELCQLATVSRPYICTRLVRIAARVHASQGRDIFRETALIRTTKVRQPETALNSGSDSDVKMLLDDPMLRMAVVRKRNVV